VNRAGSPDPAAAEIDRPRLRAILAGGTAGDGSAVIWGPAGSGKSTLVRAYVSRAARSGPAALVALSPRHQDRDVLWAAAEQALAAATGRAPVDTTRSAEDLIARWGDPRSPPLIAFDNGEQLDGVSVAAESVQLHRSPAIEFVITSRHLPPTVPRRWLLRGDVRAVGPVDLAFTPAECAELYAAAGVPDDAQPVDELMARTRGWAGAVALAVRLGARGAGDLDAARASFAQFLDEQLLAALPPEQLDLLVQLALAQDLPALFGPELLAAPNVATWIDAAADDGLLLTRSSAAGPPDMHPLVARAVERRLVHEPARRDAVYAAATVHRLAEDDPFDALRVARGSGRPDLVVDVATAHWPWLHGERPGELQAALEELPASIRSRNPSTLVLHGVLGAISHGDQGTMQSVIELATSMLDDRDLIGRLTVGYCASLVHGRASRFEDALQTCDELLADLGTRSPADRLTAAPVAALLAGAMGAVYLTMGNLPAARSRLDEATDFARLANAPISVLTWQSALALAQALEGRIDRAEFHLVQVAKIAEARTWDPIMEAASADIARALIYLEGDRSDDAQECLDRARAKPKPPALHAFLAYAASLVFLQRKAGLVAVEVVEQDLDGLGDWRPPQFLTVVAASARYSALYAAGRFDEASQLAEDVESDPGHTVCLAPARANTYLDKGDPGAALAALADCLAVERHPRRQLIFVLVLASLAELQLGSSQAAKYFTQALAIANVTGLRRAFAYFQPGHLAKLVAEVRRSGPSPEIAAMCDELDVEIAGLWNAATLPALTPRELEILALFATSLSVPELAIRLHVSPNTLKTQTRSIYRKLGVSSRASAVAMARTRGLI
jgi:LuxR family maltose regulon positive regulatory protein